MPKNKPDYKTPRFSDVANSQERKILLWFFGSLATGFIFPLAWIVTLFLGLSIIPLLLPKMLASLCIFGAQKSSSKIVSEFLTSMSAIFIIIIGLVIIAMIYGVLATPGRF